MPLNILYTNSSYYPHVGGGAEVMLQAMAEGMAARGHRVSVLASSNLDSHESINGIDVHRLRQRNIYWSFPKQERPAWMRMLWHTVDRNNLFMARPIRQLMQRIQPDVVVSHNLSGLSATVWQQAQALGIPVVHVLHDYYLICPSVTMFKGDQICQQACLRCQAFRGPHADLSNYVTGVVGVSQSILDTHLSAGLFEKTPLKRVIYNARYLPPSPSRAPLSHPQRPMVFGFIGALSEVKGIAPLIKAFMAAEQTHPGITLLVAGDGEPAYVQSLKALAPPDKVQFLGKVNALDFFKRIDVNIAPSLWNDPLPGVVYEAMSQGVPVIGAQRGGIPEIITEGLNGMLFDPSQPQALRDAIVAAAQNPERISEMQAQCRASVSRFLDVSQMLSEHETLFEQACHAQ